jgi:hypothetical protein
MDKQLELLGSATGLKARDEDGGGWLSYGNCQRAAACPAYDKTALWRAYDGSCRFRHGRNRLGLV